MPGLAEFLPTFLGVGVLMAATLALLLAFRALTLSLPHWPSFAEPCNSPRSVLFWAV
ncbi:hypothetical protein AHiyo8_23540 [Arthrobacter sp. Hiyo8]|nr:hypothetical protein AHiyo8_23540 [Arthrobacter sp. Hiyo8]